MGLTLRRSCDTSTKLQILCFLAYSTLDILFQVFQGCSDATLDLVFNTKTYRKLFFVVVHDSVFSSYNSRNFSESCQRESSCFRFVSRLWKIIQGQRFLFRTLLFLVHCMCHLFSMHRPEACHNVPCYVFWLWLFRICSCLSCVSTSPFYEGSPDQELDQLQTYTS